MSEKKPHLFFRTPQEGDVIFKQKVRFSGNQQQEEEEEEEKYYQPMKDEFQRLINSFYKDQSDRNEKRNDALKIPQHIDYIEIEFFDYFNSIGFENKYRTDFGLSPVKFSEFNTKVLFVIIDTKLFEAFVGELNKFIANTNGSYNPNIRFIKTFSFLTADRIIKYNELTSYVIIDIVDNAEIFQDYILPLEKQLENYLNENSIEYIFNSKDGKLELINVNESYVREIANNFDIIHSVNSYLAGIVKPSEFNIPEKTFGFKIQNANDDLPIIGIIDTGISKATPLKDIIINEDKEFDITGSHPLEDSANHGTSVGLLAALGNSLIPNHIGNFNADAKLLSIKILGGRNGVLAESNVIKLIRDANAKYGIKIFTLTIAYTIPKEDNSSQSDYAYALDTIANELGVLIFISIGNQFDENLYHIENGKAKIVTYPDHFDNSNANLFSPSESMNNVTIGAVAGNFENNDNECISPDGYFPAIYTRKFHINWNHHSINKTRENKMLFKPDVAFYGGDYDINLNSEKAGLKVLSTKTGMFYDRHIGTSLSAPLIANIAAKLLKEFPQLNNNMQTVKALIVNSAITPGYSDTFNDLENTTPNQLVGHGIPEIEKCIYSNENQVTLILEDTIEPKHIKSYPIKLPDYLQSLERQSSILEVNATLCFSFKPVANNHLTYCPIHIAFGIFRNIDLETRDKDGNLTEIGINGNKTENIKFKKSWSQDYYYKAKMLSNCQRLNFTISKKDLIDEKGVFKIAINSKLHKLLNPTLEKEYLKENKFSLVVTIKENPVNKKNTGRLYDEIIAINKLESIATLSADLEAEA
jgi:hypothetical protein